MGKFIKRKVKVMDRLDFIDDIEIKVYPITLKQLIKQFPQLTKEEKKKLKKQTKR